MNICSYCKTENNNTNDTNEKCSFCKSDLHIKRKKIKNIVLMNYKYDFNELDELHTLNLLQLLREVRKDRSDAYSFLTTVLKLSNSTELPEGMREHTEDDYKLYTTYKNLIEEIIKERVGYVPKRIDDKLLAAWSQRANYKL